MTILNNPRGVTFSIVIILLLLPEIAAQVNSPSDSATGYIIQYDLERLVFLFNMI